MSYDLKKLREAMDEQLPPVNLNKERILDAVREMRPVRKGRITRLVTLIAACIVLMISLGSLILPTIGDHPDHIHGQEYYLNQPQVTAEPSQPKQDVLDKPESEQDGLVNWDGVGLSS